MTPMDMFWMIAAGICFAGTFGALVWELVDSVPVWSMLVRSQKFMVARVVFIEVVFSLVFAQQFLTYWSNV